MKTIKWIFLLLAFCLAAQGQDSKISDLASASQSLNDADLFVVLQSATTKKYTFDNLQEDVFEQIPFRSNNAGLNENILFGTNTGASYSSGNNNIGIGVDIFDALNGANGNIAIGSDCYDKITTGDYNIGLGHNTANNITDGIGNIFMGRWTALVATSPDYCIGLGYTSLYNLSTAQDVIAIGRSSLYSVTTGNYNIGIGFEAGKSITTNTGTFIGYQAGELTTGDGNTFVGEGAGDINTSGAANEAFGKNALGANVTGGNNVAIGSSALAANLSNQNTAIGSGAAAAAVAAGCVYIGYQAGSTNETNNLLFIENSNTLTDVLIFGDFTNDEVIINGQASDNANSRTFFVEGTAGGLGVWNNDSDSTLKKDVSTITGALDKVMQLRGVNFKWIDEREPGNQVGFIAQEVNRVVPEIVVGESGTMSIQTASMTAVLVNAMQEQQAQIRSLSTLLYVSFVLIIICFSLIVLSYRRKTNYLKIEK